MRNCFLHTILPAGLMFAGLRRAGTKKATADPSRSSSRKPSSKFSLTTTIKKIALQIWDYAKWVKGTKSSALLQQNLRIMGFL
jgi:hypothetical protein